MKWRDFREQIRRSVLDDAQVDVTKRRWSDLQLRDYIWWALDTFAVHTAVATATGFVCDGNTLSFTLPKHVFESVEVAGAVYANSSASTVYYTPISYEDSRNVVPESAYYVRPINRVNLYVAPPAGTLLTVEYYAYYNRPFGDDDILDIPQWAENALAYLVGARAIANQSAATANIRQWVQKPDLGNPEHNPWHVQYEFFMNMYERELKRYHPQNRTLFTGFR